MESFAEIVSRCTDRAFNRYMTGDLTPCYLWLYPRTVEGTYYADVGVDGWDENGWIVAFAEYLPRNLERDQLYYWLADRMKRLPILGE